MDERQRAWSGLVQPSEIVHDTAIYRASEHERQRLVEDGVVIRRIRIDAELKSAIVRWSETARARDGRKAAEAEKRRAAAELGLPVNRMCCNFQKTARERRVGSTELRLMRPPRTAG